MSTRRRFIRGMLALAAAAQFQGFIPKFEMPELVEAGVQYFYRIRYNDGSYGLNHAVDLPAGTTTGLISNSFYEVGVQVEITAQIEGCSGFGIVEERRMGFSA